LRRAGRLKNRGPSAFCCMTKTFNKSMALLAFTAASLSIGSAQINYFLVADPRDQDWALVTDSYVLPLSRQEDVDHARYLISLGRAVFRTEGAHPLVSARVGPGKDGINRDYVDRRFPEWSWHVVQFHAFGDVSAEIIDGSPTDVENDPSWYLGLDGRQAIIGFWAYTVVRELGPVPLYVSAIPEGENLQIYWSGVGTNFVYTLEGKDSLASTNWFPIAGASWPLKTNHWVLPLAHAPAPFFRVRAETSSQAHH